MNLNNFQIELTQGCTRRCDFCGINSLSRDELVPYRFMSFELAKNISKQIRSQFKEKMRVEFAVGGEPLLNPKAAEIIEIFRRDNPLIQLSVISNGDPILKDKQLLRTLFEVGLNYLMLDFYQGNTERRDGEIMSVVEDIKKNGISVKDFYKDNIHIWQYRSSKIREVILVPPIEDYSGVKRIRTLHSAAGNMPSEVWEKYGISKSKFPVHSRCAKPFREMTIKYDGTIPICCNDWKRRVKIANLTESKIIDIWNGDLFNKYRYLLHHKRRDLIEICYWCDERSQRTGLLKLDDGKEYPELLKDAKPVSKNEAKFF